MDACAICVVPVIWFPIIRISEICWFVLGCMHLRCLCLAVHARVPARCYAYYAGHWIIPGSVPFTYSIVLL